MKLPTLELLSKNYDSLPIRGGNYKGKFTDEERVIQNTWTRIFFQPQKNFEKVSESKASLKLDVGIPKKYLWWTQLESDVFLKAQKKLKEKILK